MIDLDGFPLPENCPEPGACVRIERPEDGLAVLVLDPPHRSLAVLDGPLLRDLDAALDEIEGDSSLRGVVIAGREPLQFAAGADIDAIGAITDPAVLDRVVRMVHGLFGRIAALRPRTVAAVGGPVPGGAFELSLACDLIVAADHPKTRIGLPETQLGIVPGWGGCHRLPRRVGVPAAMQAILAGKLMPAKPAWKKRFVDRLAKPEYLRRVAADLALGREKPRRRGRGWKTWAVDRNPLATALVARQARKMVLARTRGHYPAPLRAIDLVAAACRTPLAAAAAREAAATAELAAGPVCKSLVSIFKGSEAAKKLGRGRDGFEPRRFEHGAVIGAGVMGGAIASLLAEKGIWTRLGDLDPEACDAALRRHRAEIAKKKKRRRLERHEAMLAVDRLDTTTDLGRGFHRAQIVVEAVAERLDVKRKVFAGLAAQVADDCLLATNTSSLSVSAIAEGVPHPERVVGMHFFNPVRKMPLVEVIRGEQTSEEAVTEIAALAVRLGKTPVVVADVAGFLVNRLLGPYLDEAIRLFEEGADPARIDRLMLDFGMPMGPFLLLDEVGLDIASHASQSLHEAYGERMTPATGVAEMMGPDRLGKKTGFGFYRHPKERKAKPVLADDLSRYQTGRAAAALSDAQLVDRMVLAMVNEAARCLEEKVVATAELLDLATVFGTGFAPFRGGVLRYADGEGLAAIRDRLRRIAEEQVADRPGGPARFTPAPLIEELAARGGSFR
ncbi:MAG: hypothetical protein D6702_06095 [Planctomycetota bacterium]|nr:MAG: hypothetical protein D6702_06095 [Planctomycetota bacterium]